MFQFFRRRDTAVRVFLGAILILVCITLVVTLIPGLTGSAPDTELVLARVGRERITGSELTRQLHLMVRTSRLPSSLLPMYAPQLLNQMVTEKALLLEAGRMGLSVSPEELVTQLRANPQFFVNGRFIGAEQYRMLIETRFGMSVPEFEERYREALLAEKLRRLVTSGATVSDEGVTREFHRRNDKLRIEYVLLKMNDVKQEVQLSDTDVSTYFAKNRTRYEIPERRQFRFVFLDTAKAKESVQVTEQELQRSYNENKGRYRVEERVRASHILLKTVGKTPAETEEIQKKAAALLARLQKGEDFGKVAKENSDDAASTPKGGDLGWIVRGQTVPEFEKTAFSLGPGSLSEVIKTVYGFHIMKVQERQRAHQQTLEEVREQILPQVKQQKALALVEEIGLKAENALRKNPGNLQAVAEQLGFQVTETGLLKRGDPLPQAGASAALDEALFAAGLRPNQLTPVISLTNGLVIASLVQISPVHPAELNEVREMVENDLRNGLAATELGARMKRLADQTRREGDLKKAAAAHKLTVVSSDLFTRDGSIKDLGPASSLGDAAFRMKPGDVGDPVSVAEGQVVFRVLERQQAPEEELAKTREDLRSQLAQEKADSLFQLFVDAMRSRLEREGKLTVNEAALQRLTSSMQE